FFFFSSRRRHTRSKRDWSSDVCSSDLEADILAKEEPSAAPNWVLGAFLYVSYNLSAGAALLIVLSGLTKDRKIAGRGGLLGGLMLGSLIVLIHLGMFVKIDVVAGLDMPTLALANEIHPMVGI